MDSELRAAIRDRRSLFLASIALFSLIVIIGLALTWMIRPIPFSSSLWKECSHQRSRMVENLVASGNLLGRSQAEIHDLLGVPSGTDSIRGDHYIYWTGYAGIDDSWLELEFTDGHVSNVHHYAD